MKEIEKAAEESLLWADYISKKEVDMKFNSISKNSIDEYSSQWIEDVFNYIQMVGENPLDCVIYIKESCRAVTLIDKLKRSDIIKVGFDDILFLVMIYGRRLRYLEQEDKLQSTEYSYLNKNIQELQHCLINHFHDN